MSVPILMVVTGLIWLAAGEPTAAAVWMVGGLLYRPVSP